jgi:hypothetical protein
VFYLEIIRCRDMSDRDREIRDAISALNNVRVVFVQSIIHQYRLGRDLSDLQVDALFKFVRLQETSLVSGFTGVDHGKTQEQWEDEVRGSKLPWSLVNIGKTTIKYKIPPVIPLKSYTFHTVKKRLSLKDFDIEKICINKIYYEYRVFSTTSSVEYYFKRLCDIVFWFNNEYEIGDDRVR